MPQRPVYVIVPVRHSGALPRVVVQVRHATALLELAGSQWRRIATWKSKLVTSACQLPSGMTIATTGYGQIVWIAPDGTRSEAIASNEQTLTSCDVGSDGTFIAGATFGRYYTGGDEPSQFESHRIAMLGSPRPGRDIRCVRVLGNRTLILGGRGLCLVAQNLQSPCTVLTLSRDLGEVGYNDAFDVDGTLWTSATRNGWPVMLRWAGTELAECLAVQATPSDSVYTAMHGNSIAIAIQQSVAAFDGTWRCELPDVNGSVYGMLAIDDGVLVFTQTGQVYCVRSGVATRWASLPRDLI